jgi:hypothetical protein
MAPLTPFIVSVNFDVRANRRDFSERFETLSEAASYAEMARGMEDVRLIAIDFRLSERSMEEPANGQPELGTTSSSPRCPSG